MTREQFEKELDSVALDYPFMHTVNLLKAHDAEQRQEIARLQEKVNEGASMNYSVDPWVLIAELRQKIAAKDQEIATLTAMRIKYGPICVVCGAAEPCELKDDPFAPCTFDPAPKILYAKCEEQRQKIERLREDLDCAERALFLLRAERIKEHP